MVVGAFPDMPYKSQEQEVPAFSRLYVFSDGVYEVTKADGIMLKYEEFVQTLTDSRRHTGSALEYTVAGIRTLLGGQQFEDDVSMVEVTF
jgi:sigma-B regulation protein RsbU (phosphoserine phosphatase)